MAVRRNAEQHTQTRAKSMRLLDFISASKIHATAKKSHQFSRHRDISLPMNLNLKRDFMTTVVTVAFETNRNELKCERKKHTRNICSVVVVCEDRVAVAGAVTFIRTVPGANLMLTRPMGFFSVFICAHLQMHKALAHIHAPTNYQPGDWRLATGRINNNSACTLLFSNFSFYAFVVLCISIGRKFPFATFSVRFCNPI